MKILIPMHEIQDYGGITGHIEYLIRGLQEAGHETEFVLLRNNDQPPYRRKSEGPIGSYASRTGGSVHLLAGWYGVPVMSYGTEDRAREFIRYADQYDFIIWGLPCPYRDDGPWRGLYRSSIPQVACVHDAHYPKAYKHLDDINDYLCFLAPVNESALGALRDFPGEVKLIHNGHRLLDWKKELPWGSRNKTAICAHVWKAWKNMDRVVAAGPYTDSMIIMGGDGIEGRYMRSKMKCKPKYQGLWDAYLEAGHRYAGVMPEEILFEWYAKSSVGIDLSYNARFASYGAHYNRSIVEYINHGMIPLVAMENMENSSVFPPDSYCCALNTMGPYELGVLIDRCVNATTEEAKNILEAGREVLVEHFDYRRTSLQYLQAVE